MNTGKFILSTLGYAVATTAIAVFWHENLFGTLYQGFQIYSNAEAPNILLAVIGSFIEGAVLSYLFQRFAPAANRVVFGITLGVLLCLFASSYDVFQTAALEKVQGAGTGSFVAVEWAAMVIYGVVGGAIVGWINR